MLPRVLAFRSGVRSESGTRVRSESVLGRYFRETGEFPVVLDSRRVVRQSRLPGCGKETEKMGLPIQRDDRVPLLTFFPGVSVNALYSGSRVLAHRGVTTVLGVGTRTKIGESVVVPDPVDVVYRVVGPLPGHVEPRQFMLRVQTTEHPNHPIPDRGRASGPLSRLDLLAAALEPGEVPGRRVVVKNFAELGLGQ